jgi:RimJ/RimL family protein N-acetyltransferase
MEGLYIRYSVAEDKTKWEEWLSEKGILRWFPMSNKMEIQDAVRIWESFIPQKAILTAEIDGVPCGVANIYPQQFKKLQHQCLFAIIIDQNYRGKGIGSALITKLMEMAKEEFNIEIMHLEVYQGNPAIKLYERLGFKVIGSQKRFLKEGKNYYTKVFMQRYL